MSGDAEDFDLLAAIYVLGALEPDEAHAVEELAARDSAVALAIEAWQNRLAPLAAVARPVPPPDDLWQRIETSVGLPPEEAAPVPAPAPEKISTVTRLGKAWRSVAVWRGATAAMALAAAVAGFVILSRPEPMPYAAALTPMGSPAPVFLAQMRSDGSLMVRPLTVLQATAGRDMELWALPEGAAKPVSLGVLPAIGRSVPMANMPKTGVQLLVSLEPEGGSPTGLPTGPVLYAGTLRRL